MTEPRFAEASAVKLALLNQQAHAQSDTLELLHAEPIAVIGMGCRFPGGANDPESYWQLLRDGVDAIREVPAERWNAAALLDPDPSAPGKMTTRWGGFLDQVDGFDAGFFGISPREAARMDPQQRLLLEVACEALDDAGQTRERLAGSPTGVFVGSYNDDYAHLQLADFDSIDAYTSTGTAHSIVANRVSYLLHLQGPSLAIDSACSSSLVAVHLACQSLRLRECGMALAGGVSLILSPEQTVSLSKWGFMTPDGRCKTFDASADGFVRGEGAGVVVLKRLADALADGDRILGLIRGSAVNQDGRTSVMTAPSGLAQQAVIRQALAHAQVRPEEISYVEAHGTGTILGDPIEVEALSAVLGAPGPDATACALTSVKTNIGHLEGAAGIAGLIKVLLCMRHGAIPQHLHLETLNPNIELDGTRFFVPTAMQAWSGGRRRFAGVSSFGFGGTNAHVILEEAPTLPRRTASTERTWLLPLSARDDDALDELAAAYTAMLDGDVDVADVCFTAAVRRTHREHRLAVSGRSRDELRQRLATRQLSRGAQPAGQATRLAFVFSGQGAQWWAMGRELMAEEPVFRATVERVATLLGGYADWSLLDELMADEAHSRLDQTAIAQPAIFAIQVALAELWRHWGIAPDAVIGHSVGEVAAAYVAGALSLEDAVRVVYHRARLMQAATGLGSMAAIELEPSAIEPLLVGHGDAVSVGAVNSRSQTVISGTTTAVEAIVNAARSHGVRARTLGVNYAFHSAQMAPFAEELARVLHGLSPRRPTLTVISSVTGQLAGERAFDADYWASNVRQTVRFAAAVDTLAALEPDLSAVVEISAHPVLGAPLAEVLADRGFSGAAVVPSARRGAPERDVMLASLAQLYVRGGNVAWDHVSSGGQAVALPAYPWQRQRYWLEPRPATSSRRTPSGHPLVGERVRAPGLADTIYQTHVSAAQPAFLGDHRLRGEAVFPATAYVEAVLATAEAAFGDGPHALTDIELVEPLHLTQEPLTLSVHLRDGDQRSFEVFSLDADDKWVAHARGQIVTETAGETRDIPLAAITAELPASVPAEAHYAALARRGLDFGAGFQGVTGLAVGDGRALGEIDASLEGPYALHPAALDACLQSLLALLPPGADLYLPLSIERVRCLGRLRGTVWALATLRHADDGAADAGLLVGDVTVLDAAGRPLVQVDGVALRRVAPGALRRHADDWVRAPLWQPEPADDPATVAIDAASGRWLILTDQGGVGRGLADRLRANGGTVELAVRGEFDVADIDGSEPLRGVVYLWPLDLVDAQGAWTAEAEDVVNTSALHLVQALVERAPTSRLCLVTRGAQAAGGRHSVATAQTTLWGLANTVRLEHPSLQCAAIDLDPTSDADSAAAHVLREVLRVVPTQRLALRGDVRLVERPGGAPLHSTPGSPPAAQRLEIDQRGTLEALTLRAGQRAAPRPGEVEVRVHASGLNFRDVLNALGLYPGDAGALGGECAGEVTRIGAGVTSLDVGDRVVGIASAAFATYVTTPAQLLVRMPASLTFAAAATLPVAFLTAAEALEHLAQLRQSERVLIHAAAGGVGLAAVQIALRLGAEVFATAGSELKRDYLRGLGVAHVLDSRSLDFADEILARTDGQGVDVVLNSLSDAFIPASLRALARHGRFIEIGKRDIWTAEQVAVQRPDARYHVVYLGDQYAHEAERVGVTLHRIVDGVDDGALQPLPHRVFPLADAVDGFRYMAQARHIGKVVLLAPTEAATRLADAIQPDVTYAVTGGTGGIGQHLARWLVEHGARHLLLISRHGAQSADAVQTVAELRLRGARVEVARADVANCDELGQVLRDAAATLPPLRGVFHAAGVVDDGVLQEQDARRFKRVMAAKAAGAWNLHQLTRELPLQMFVLCSSIAASLGSAGQANYATANAYLDGLAYRRRSEGLPALSIGWGAWAATGMTAALGDADTQRLLRRGIHGMPPEQALERMGQLSVFGPPHVLIAHFASANTEGPSGPTSRPARATAPGVLERWSATPAAQRRALLVGHIHAEVARVLGLPSAQTIPARQPFNELGLDSLGAVELRNALGASLACPLPPTLLFDRPTTESLVDFLLRHVPALRGADDAHPTDDGHAAHQPGAGATDLDDLSEAEAEALLLAELAGPPRSRSTAAR